MEGSPKNTREGTEPLDGNHEKIKMPVLWKRTAERRMREKRSRQKTQPSKRKMKKGERDGLKREKKLARVKEEGEERKFESWELNDTDRG